jgi:outer membrane biosynthesis protein TonB
VSVSAIAEPRLGGGFVASALFHGALVAAFYLMRPGTPPPSPPIYRVQLFAAPPGERAIGVVQNQPVPTPPPETKTEKPKPVAKPVATKPVPKPATKSVPAVKQVTPTPPVKAAPPKEATPQPVAGGGPTGGKGADVSNVDTGGLDFNYPGYTSNIIRQLILAWGQGAPRYDAVVRFTIKRDGTVDPESIQLVTHGNYANDRRAIGAVEQVADGKLFGALPPGFREDILPVTVRFTPSMFK